MKKLLLILTVLSCSFVNAQIPSHSKVYQEIVSSGIKYAEVAFAQAILESGHFKSKVAKQNNNLFGMRIPRYRSTTAVGKLNGYARYLSWQASVQDYKIWQDNLFKRYPNMTKAEFKSYLNRLYSTSSNYMAKVNAIINKNKNKYEKDHHDRDSIRSIHTDSLWVSSN